ncbi:MAG TPA: FAD-dependent oxidoreductase [Baekduia sp.]|nr:FAD-dependent oxidoreductase [Baekduia sp.]
MSRILSSSQLETLAQHGVELTAEPGEVLFQIGDSTYPFIAIIEGEVAILDGAGAEVVRHGASGFLGEMNLLSGQTVFLTAVVRSALRYIAVERETLRQLLFEDSGLSDVLLAAFIARRELLQTREGIGMEIIGPRDSSDTRRLTDFARQQRLPFTWTDPRRDAEAKLLIEALEDEQLPLVRLPGGVDLYRPTNGELSRALGVGLELAERESVDLLIVGGGPAGLGAAVYGASEGLDTLVIESTVMGGQAGSSRRIENYLGFPAGISGTELASRAITQARKFGTRTATPYRAEALEPGAETHTVRLDGGVEVTARSVVIATGAEYRRLPVENLDQYEGISIFYAAGPLEAQTCGAQRVGIVGGGNSAGQAAVWLARGGALVTLLHRRADLRETMSSYLIDDLGRFGVSVRDHSEITTLYGDDGQLEAVALSDGERLPLSFLFLFLGASPCTDWLGDVCSRDDDGFILTGSDAGASGLLETSIPGVFAVGDVRAGSTKRCATAVGEGAAAVRYVHERVAAAGASS